MLKQYDYKNREIILRNRETYIEMTITDKNGIDFLEPGFLLLIELPLRRTLVRKVVLCSMKRPQRTQ
jgi:hypothetical protein